MSNFRFAVFASYDKYYVKSQWKVFELVFSYEKICRPCHSNLLRFCNGAFGVGKIFAASCLNLNKDDRPIRLCHNQVYLPCFAQKVARNKLAALFFKELFAQLLAFSAEQVWVWV